jgi:PDZ domain-containing secreted protein
LAFVEALAFVAALPFVVAFLVIFVPAAFVLKEPGIGNLCKLASVVKEHVADTEISGHLSKG